MTRNLDWFEKITRKKVFWCDVRQFWIFLKWNWWKWFCNSKTIMNKEFEHDEGLWPMCSHARGGRAEWFPASRPVRERRQREKDERTTRTRIQSSGGCWSARGPNLDACNDQTNRRHHDKLQNLVLRLRTRFESCEWASDEVNERVRRQVDPVIPWIAIARTGGWPFGKYAKVKGMGGMTLHRRVPWIHCEGPKGRIQGTKSRTIANKEKYHLYLSGNLWASEIWEGTLKIFKISSGNHTRLREQETS
jgi:hypothetical protein